MQDRVFQEKISEVVETIKATGLDPYAQLAGYLRAGNIAYITQQNNARSKVKCLDAAKIQQFIASEKGKGLSR